jgi:probable rRNA maturation factor
VIKNLSINNSSGTKIDKKLIHKIVKKLSEDLNFKISGIQINFINSKEITEINRKYLKHNYSTDIITFNYSDTKSEIDGEIYISVEDAASNSIKFEVTFVEEILRLVIHGFLHLVGYNDNNSTNKVIMKRLENKLFNQYKVLVS